MTKLQGVGMNIFKNALAGLVAGLFVLVLHAAPAEAAPVEITVDPDGYTGRWVIQGATSFLSGRQTVSVEPGTRRVQIGVGGIFLITVSTDGTVTSLNSDAATALGNVLTFENTTISVDPDGYTGLWSLQFAADHLPGARSVLVVPGVNYRVRIGVGGSFLITVAGDGTVTSLNPDAATVVGGVLTFENTTISVDPDGYTGFWSLQFAADSLSGAQSVLVVPGVRYRFLVNGQKQDFSVAEPCAVDPTQFDLAGFTFNITCGAPDTDEDGVPDDTDNCPAIPNPDQVDQDLDGLGNLCDADLDGDGVDNDFDNCPGIENTMQEDLDLDGAGDACDLDVDGDAVPDQADNCPLVANTGQADSDGDLSGDACDTDDDNDGVDDGVDNCPLIANFDQFDFDGDGDGDACEDDTDGDGVSNTLDMCPGSPLNQPVDFYGCTGAQSIALACDRDNFVQHGQYVSCVAHAASDAVDEGLLSPKQKARFVKEAAKKPAP